MFRLFTQALPHHQSDDQGPLFTDRLIGVIRAKYQVNSWAATRWVNGITNHECHIAMSFIDWLEQHKKWGTKNTELLSLLYQDLLTRPKEDMRQFYHLQSVIAKAACEFFLDKSTLEKYNKAVDASVNKCVMEAGGALVMGDISSPFQLKFALDPLADYINQHQCQPPARVPELKLRELKDRNIFEMEPLDDQANSFASRV